MLELTGKPINPEVAIEFLEALSDVIPDEVCDEVFCEEFTEALNTFRYCASRMLPIIDQREQRKTSSAERIKLQLIEEIAGNELETGSGACSEHFLTVLNAICTIIHFQTEE